MPLYEYECGQCGRRFEMLMRASVVPECPSCGATRVERALSTFAVGGATGAAASATSPAPCGRCGDPRGAGACSLD